jgi:hypothetical protein
MEGRDCVEVVAAGLMEGTVFDNWDRWGHCGSKVAEKEHIGRERPRAVGVGKHSVNSERLLKFAA